MVDKQRIAGRTMDGYIHRHVFPVAQSTLILRHTDKQDFDERHALMGDRGTNFFTSSSKAF